MDAPLRPPVAGLRPRVRATLATIAQAARFARIGPPATTVIGAVAGFVPGRVTAESVQPVAILQA